VPDVVVRSLLRTPIVAIGDCRCRGSCRHATHEESTSTTQLIFPYRGVYVRHLGQDQAVADANQVVFFNAGEGYRVSHPLAGGDASLMLVVDEPHLQELAPRSLLREGPRLAFHRQRSRIDARTQALVALLRHRLSHGITEPLEAESLALALVKRTLGPRTAHAPGSTFGRQRLVDRVKLVLASDPSRRFTLSEIAAEVRGSPVYLTQVFSQVEGMPLYQYQLRLRLARALDLLGEYEDLTVLGLDLGFSSHSHFSGAFRAVYGRTPSDFRRSARRAAADR
jgi:AraC-like DNA-binding protein